MGVLGFLIKKGAGFVRKQREANQPKYIEPVKKKIIHPKY
jgi:hypothetical protein